MLGKVAVILLLATLAIVQADEDIPRSKRSLQPGGPDINKKPDQPWQLDPNIERDNKGNTKTNIEVKHRGENSDFEAGWSKVIKGPNKAKPTYHVGGSIRWRRSLQPGAPNAANKNDQTWEFNPNLKRDKNGNTQADINLKRHGENHDLEASWSKVVRGPKKAQPTYHVGGSVRWRRSLQPGAPGADTNNGEPWEFNPNLQRDKDGNTQADINLKRHGENHDFEAGWSKVVGGPKKAQPTWHVGGAVRWRRSAEEDDDDKDKQPWEFNPNLERDKDGNTKADINLKRHGENHDIEASWSKVVDGSKKAKPTFKVGGSFRWRRSAEDDDKDKQPWEFNPNLERDGDGNTKADINLKRHGENHDIEASWSKVVDGSKKAKPTFKVGGSFRWRRAAE